MAKTKTAANAVIDLFAPKKASGALPTAQTTRMGDVGFDPRFDDRIKEQQRLNDLTTTVEKRAAQNIPSIYLPDYEGYGYVSSMSDRSAGGGSLIDINNVSLKRPVDLQGGQYYMFENPGQVWASGDTPSRAIMMQAAAAKALTGRDPLYLPHRMAPTGSDFATMTGETMLSFAESNMGRDAKKALNNKIKEFIPDWKGIDSPKSIDQFRSQPDANRKAIHAMMDKDFRNEGGLGIGEARLSIADPKQLNAPVGYLMNVGRIFADQPLLQQSGHASYPRGIPGEGIGRINDERSFFELYPKTFPEEGKEKVIRPLLLDPATALTEYNRLPNAVEARSIANPKQPSSDDTRDLQMKPYYGILTEDILRKMGYAQGGLVDSAPEQAIADTVRNPAAARMLDIDAANFALMQQPQRMAGGGAMKKIVKPVVKKVMPEVQSPSIMTRSEITELADYIKNREGGYGLRRVERAADEIPRLGEMYTPDALRSAFSGDNARALMTMNPADFERYATPLLTNLSQQSKDNIANLKSIQGAGGFSDVPFFLVNKELAGSTGVPFVTGHEGRHRSRAMDAAGVQSGLVQFLPRAELREPFPRKSQEQYIDAIRKEMALSGNKIKPENYYLNETDEKSFQRPAIDLPDFYADGGQVQRFDEGGEVNQPSLDQMRYELDRANSPVMQATPRGPVQSAIGTLGGYIDRAGKFVSEAIEPTAERNPVKHFLADMLLAAPLKGMGTALQDYTGTARETDEDNPVRGVISKDFRNLTTSREPMLDPRVLDIAQFAAPVIKGATKLAGAGVKAITPFATRTDDMVRELYASGAMPQPGLSIKDVTPKALAPASDIGFYSPTEAAALNVQRKSGAGQAFLNDITKGENVSSEEISAMGLDTFLKDKKNVTADEVQDYVAKNKMQLGEAKYFDNTDEEAKQLADQYNYEFVRNEGFFDNAEQEFVDYRNLPTELRQFINLEKPTKYSEYQLPGGENYREIVLTLPDPKDAMMDQVRALGITKNKDSITINDILQRGGSDELAEGWQNASKNTYKSSHFSEPNVLSHLRVSDRVTDGKLTLLLDEVQSDMHQAARDARTLEIERLVDSGMSKNEAQASVPKDFGYRLPPEVTAPMDSEYRALVHKNADAVNQGLAPNPQDVQRAQSLERQLMQSDTSKIPDAPYKEDWYQLTLRRAIKEAVDGGYDRVALPTGARVADRFKLTHQVDEIVYGNKGDIHFYKNGDIVQNLSNKKPEELGAIVGKEVAQKLLNSEPNKYGTKTLRGVDLEVGGEGMKKYYDEIYPTYLKKFGKKYGSQSGMTTVDAGGTPEPLHYMEITPAMRKEFSTGIHMKRGGKVHFASNLDAMRQELTQRR